MDSSPQNSTALISLWDADQDVLKGSGRWLGQFSLFWESHRQRFAKAAGVYTSISRRIVAGIDRSAPPVRLALAEGLARWQAARPALLLQSRKLLPFLLQTDVTGAHAGPDPVDTILSDFGSLERAGQDKVAKNLALLWDNFQNMFGGISGFLAAPGTEQDAFMEKLTAAAERMEAARGTEAAFHYVTVELTRQYISYFRIGRADPKAVALATCVVSLIDRGRRMSLPAGASGRP